MKIPTDLPHLSKLDIVVDNSILSDMVCSTRGTMRHVLGLTVETEGVELKAGSALHEGLARLIVTKDRGAALKRFDRVYKPWADEHVPKVDAKTQKPSRLRWEPVHRIFEHWLRTHDLEKGKAFRDLRFDPAWVEIPVWAPLGHIHHSDKMRPIDEVDKNLIGTDNQKTLGPVIFFVALLDAIVEKRVGGGRWSWDWKTSSSLGPWYKEGQEDSSQFTGQLWGAQQRGFPLNGIWLYGIELPPLNSSLAICKKHGVAFAKCALEHVDTLMFPITRSQHEIAAWEQTARGLTKKFLRLRAGVRDVQDVRELPMEGRFINRGCSRCTFREFCREGRPKHWPERKLVVDRWSPLEHAQRRGGLRDKET